MSSHPGCGHDTYSSSASSPIPLKSSTDLQAWRSGMGSGRFTVDGGGGLSGFEDMNTSAQQQEGSLALQPNPSQYPSNMQSSSSSHHLTPYHHLAIPSTQVASMPYQLEGPSSVPTNFGWPGHQAGLNFASVPSSPVFGFRMPTTEGLQLAQLIEHGSEIAQNHHFQPSSAPADHHTYEQSPIEQIQPPTDFGHHGYDRNTRQQSLLTLQKPVNSSPDSQISTSMLHKQPQVGSASESPSISKQNSNPNNNETWHSGSSSTASTDLPTTSGIDISNGVTPSLLIPSRPPESRSQNASTHTMGSQPNLRMASLPVAMSAYPQVLDRSNGSRFCVVSPTLVSSPLMATFPNAQLSSRLGIHTSNSHQATYPRTGRIGSTGGKLTTAESNRARSNWHPFRDSSLALSPQSSTGSSFSTCDSPSTPYSPSWIGIRNARSDSLSSPVSSRTLPFGRDGWSLDQADEGRQAEAGDQNVLHPDLWKMCGLDQPSTVPTNDALEQLMNKMRELGLNEDQIRMHLSRGFPGDGLSKSEEGDDDRLSDRTANNRTVPNVSLRRTNQKTDKKPEEDEILAKADQDQISHGGGFDQHSGSLGTRSEINSNTAQSSCASQPSASHMREPSIERGRRTRNADRTASYLDAALQADSEISIEMEWRTHSRSRSRPPETTNMDWRQASRSRSRRPCRPLDLPQAPPTNSDLGINFQSSHLYKSFKTHATHEVPSTNSLTNSLKEFLIPLADRELSTPVLESVDERSDGFSDYGPKSIHQNEYEHRVALAKLIDEMSQPNETFYNSRDLPKLGRSESEVSLGNSGEQTFINSQHRIAAGRLSEFDSGILGLPTTPSHSSLLGSIPGLDQDLAKVANAHAEYGSLPRLVRKTSFDETLVQQNAQSIHIRQSYLNPRATREQGASSNGNTLGGVGAVDGNSGRSLSPDARPSTAFGSGRRIHQSMLPSNDLNVHETTDYATSDAPKLAFEALSRPISPKLEDYISRLNSTSVGSREAYASNTCSSPALTSLPPSNEAAAFEYLNSSAFNGNGTGMSSTGQEGLNSTAAASTNFLRSVSLGNHPSLYNTSFSGVSVSTPQSPLTINNLSDYDILQFTQPFDDHLQQGLGISNGVFSHSESHLLGLHDPVYSIHNQGDTHTSVGGLPQNRVRLSEIQALSSSESVQPVTINPAQLHPTAGHYSTVQPTHVQTQTPSINPVLYPSSVRSLSSGSSSGSSESSRASSLSSSTITGHQVPVTHLQTLPRTSEITSSTPGSSPTSGPRLVTVAPGTPLRTLGRSSNTFGSLGQTSGSGTDWKGHTTSNELPSQKKQSFSGGRSSHTSSIVQARKRSKALPYGLTTNGTSSELVLQGTLGDGNVVTEQSRSQHVVVNGIEKLGIEKLGSSRKKSCGGGGGGGETGEDEGIVSKSMMIGSSEQEVGTNLESNNNNNNNNNNSSSLVIRCLNCAATVSKNLIL
ncbi:hypothetical protein CROQUDRAFT_671760 [Cronartium quercuum f. sp. fusiforme G11]|uniref:Uncharacterized protein n=1 Tax=Cronartium quercuum f. sp. fusiforme G11 TaxID=708437 RepID=A0A9P6NEK6_9BASI|nr:hypothetical protein CROQUDRAFT_671760 [Cronartium quercuum f. sp. fusiforme G11]